MERILSILLDTLFLVLKAMFNRLNKDIFVELQRQALETTVDYIKENMLDIESVDSRYSLLKRALEETKIKGMYLEFGVYKGKTINFIASIKKDEEIYGFDSFDGLPKFWRDGFSKGTFSLDKLPRVNKNVILIKGLFDKSLVDFLERHKGNCAFIHIDSDLYSSAETIFNLIKKRIKKGTVIVFDEFFNYPGWKKGEFSAFNEFIKKNKLHYRFISYNRNHEQVAVQIV